MALRAPEEELYDTQADPHEIANLADSTKPEHHQVKVWLLVALDTWITSTGDLGQWPEPPEVVAPFEKEMHDWFVTPAWFGEASQSNPCIGPVPLPSKALSEGRIAYLSYNLPCWRHLSCRSPKKRKTNSGLRSLT